MKFSATLISILPLLSNAQADEPPTKQIVGGTEVTVGRYPYQVALVDSDGFQFCGASLIAPNYVLSAAHCAGGVASVQIGRHDLSADEVFEDIPVIAETLHPGYDDCTTENDVMVLTLSSSSSADPVTLDDGSTDLSAGIDVTVMGWGTTSSGGSSSDVLLEVDVDVVSNSDCEAAYGTGQITSDMMCAARSGKDSCQGDSGGPLIVKGSDAASDVQVGIVSWGFGCADEDFPGVYASVSFFLTWIQEQMTRKTSEMDKLKFRVRKMFGKPIRGYDPRK